MKPLLQIRQACLKTGNQKSLLSNVNLCVNRGEFVILVGENGSGKSTLLKAIQRIYRLTSGDVLLNKINLNQLAHKTLSKNILSLTQHACDNLFMELSILDNAKLLTGLKKKELLNYLEPFNPKFTKYIEQPVKLLSGGEQQTLAFALYLQRKPELLLLDEHTSALDPKAAKRLLELTYQHIKSHQISAIMTTHHIERAMQYADRIIEMKNGELISDTNEKTQNSLHTTAKASYSADPLLQLVPKAL